ncbi:subtilisin-like protease SBT5.4 [Carex rostrata]
MGYTFLWFALLSFFLLKENAIAADKVPYIVYLGESPSPLAGISQELQHTLLAKSHCELLGSILGTLKEARDAIFYSYTQYINGFAAIIDPETADKISKLPGVVSVFPSKGHQLHTTRSWRFLGLESDGYVDSNSLWSKAAYGNDTIIGNLDTGVWPESESFADDGMANVPIGWKGICQNQSDPSFTCNKKLIGARYFNKGYNAFLVSQNKSLEALNISLETPRDNNGHGTHTLSTAGGAFVANANLFGHGNGIAKGGSPHARVAAYKVCWPPVNGGECFDADILAAFDAAIADSVHILSLSLGGDPGDYFQDGIAIGSFHAVNKGIKVVCSAGNSGPTAGTVSNIEPWIFTVAASTMDREFFAYVSFGNNSIKGQSLSSTSLTVGEYPIINSTDAQAANSTANDALLCLAGSLDPTKVKGSIVICTRGTNARVEKGQVVLEAGGVGMVRFSLNQHRVDPAPQILSFSLPFSPVRTNTGAKNQRLRCLLPLSGYLLLLRAFSPFRAAFFFSESAQRLIQMARFSLNRHRASTTDNQGQGILDSSFETATPFSYGSGHVNPNAAADPGLIYDLNTIDYLNFLYYHAYSTTKLALVKSGCLGLLKSQDIKDFNYPSFTIYNLTGSVTVTRTVKNVGPSGTYTATVEKPSGIQVTVEPDSLMFYADEEKKFKVTLEVVVPGSDYVFGSITWSDGTRYVRSPVAVLTSS